MKIFGRPVKVKVATACADSFAVAAAFHREIVALSFALVFAFCCLLHTQESLEKGPSESRTLLTGCSS